MTDTDIKLPEPANPEGSMACEDCSGTGVFGESYGGSEFQPPSYDPCESCGGSGKWNLPLFTGDQMRAAILADRAERAAPAVPPEVWALQWPDDSRLNLSTMFDTEAEAQSYVTDHTRTNGILLVPLYRAAPAAAAPSSAAEPSDNFEMPNTFKLPGESDEAWVDRITGASQSAPPQGAAAEVEKAIDAYIEEYEMYCEDEGGREGFYSPSERERDLIKDAIMGLLADDDFCAAFTPQRNAAQEIAHQLRAACLSVRSKSYPLADLIPLMQQAADELSTSTGATP